MGHKENINKIHYDLTSQFENVAIEENANRTFGNYVKIEINEKLKLNIIIEKVAIESDTFRWFYLSDPDNENSIIERRSDVLGFKDDIKEIFEKKRFDQGYINKVEESVGSVTQSLKSSADSGTLGGDIYDIVKKFGKNQVISSLEGLMGSKDIDADGINKIDLIQTIKKIEE